MPNKGFRKIYEDNKDAIIKDYAESGSAWVTGKKFGMLGNTLYRYLNCDNIEKHRVKHTPKIKKKIEVFYKKGFRRGESLDALSESMGIHKGSVCQIAKEMGLTDKSRESSKKTISKMASTKKNNWSVNREEMLKKHKSPFGSFTKEQMTKNGKIASAEFKRIYSGNDDLNKKRNIKILKTRFSRGNYSMPRKNTTWRAGYRTIGGRTIWFRSRWEANYARYLQFLKDKGAIKEWEFEKTVYWFEKIRRGVVSYLPDFNVFENNGRMDHHEVKGWMDARSKTKLKRMKKYYPEKTVLVIDKKWFAGTGKKIKGLIPDWES